MKVADTLYTDQIKQEQIRTLYTQSVYLFLGLLVLMAGILIYFLDKTDNVALLVWFVVNVSLLILRAILVKRFHKISPQGESVYTWGKLFALSSFLSGCLWGIFPIIFIEAGDLVGTTLMIIVLMGMLSTSMVPLSSYIPAYISFSIPAMLPLIVRLLSSSSSMLLLVGSLFTAALIAHVAFSFVINRNLATSLQLRFENLDLLKGLEEQKERAEKANKDKSRFLAATSHDLRQPLHAMDLYLGALKNVLSTGEQHELLAKSQSSSKALAELLNALMDISRLDAGSINIDKKTLALKPLLDEICQSMQGQAAQQHLSLKCNVDDVNVYSDPILFARMVRNLLSNAIKHSKGSQVFISTEHQGDNVTLNIIDNGKGIVDTELENIFSEFYQLNNPERDRNKGLGLGLAIVKRIAHQLEHAISVSSVLAQGSTFSIRLPVKNEAEEIQQTQSDIERFDLSGLFTIIIEDEASVRDAMRLLLRSWDCEVLMGDSLAAIDEALDQADYPAPDIIISDYRLRQNQTGLEAVKSLRHRFERDIPAIVVTGDTGKEIAQQISRQRCTVAYKPVNADNFQAMIAALISN